MTIRYGNPALEAELAYRREQLQAAQRGTKTRVRWLPLKRHTLS